VKAAKRLKPPRSAWHTVKGMYDYVDSLNRRRRQVLLMRAEKYCGICSVIDAEVMGYISEDGRWLSDYFERKNLFPT
jgi:hypothetical protein